jgi:PAS domain S-box-containing protein
VVVNARSLSLQTQRERRYLALMENANEIIYTYDLEGNFTSMNSAGEQTLGYSASEIRKLNVLQVVVPKYRQLVQSMIEETLDVQIRKTDQLELVTKYGRTLNVEADTHPIYLEGKVIEIQAIVRSVLVGGQPDTLLVPAQTVQPVPSRNLTNSFTMKPAFRIGH